MALRPTSYVPHRWFIYSLLWCISVIELALTAFRIRHTNSLFGTYDPIVAELLVTSILTIIWVPFTLLLHRSANASADTGAANVARGGRFSPWHGETGGNLVLWIMWLVGAAVVTHKWPTRAIAAVTGERDIVTTIVAFAWIAFSLLTIAKIFGLMEYAAMRAAGTGAGPMFAREKPAGGPGIGRTTGPAAV